MVLDESAGTSAFQYQPTRGIVYLPFVNVISLGTSWLYLRVADGESAVRFPYRSRSENSTCVSVIDPSIYIGTPGRILNCFSDVLPIPAISTENIWSHAIRHGVKTTDSARQPEREIVVLSNEPAHCGISIVANEENPDISAPLVGSTISISTRVGSPPT